MIRTATTRTGLRIHLLELRVFLFQDLQASGISLIHQAIFLAPPMQGGDGNLLLLTKLLLAQSAPVALAQQSDNLFWFTSLSFHSSRIWLSKSSHFTWTSFIGGGRVGSTVNSSEMGVRYRRKRTWASFITSMRRSLAVQKRGARLEIALTPPLPTGWKSAPSVVIQFLDTTRWLGSTPPARSSDWDRPETNTGDFWVGGVFDLTG